MARLYTFAVDRVCDLTQLSKIVPGVGCVRGDPRQLTAHLNSAWLLEQQLREAGVAYRVTPPRAQPRVRWSEIVERARAELLPWVPDFLARYQKEGLVFAMNAPDESASLHHPTGCLTGDTELVVNRAGNARRLRLDHLVAKFNGGESRNGKHWRSDVATHAQSMINGYARLNQITAAYVSGEREVLEIVTRDGRRICPTADHGFLLSAADEWIWTPAGELRPGQAVAVVTDAGRGAPRRRKPQYLQTQIRGPHHPRVQRIELRRTDGWCQRHGFRPGYVEVVWRVPTHILVAEAGLNGLTFDAYVSRLRLNHVGNLTFLEKSIHVHHKDGNTKNNALANLEVLSAEEHLRRHGEGDGWQNVTARVVPDVIERIVPLGVRPTYDLSMAAPHNNYVANDFIVHNSGKSISGIVWALTRPGVIVFITKAAARETIRREFERYTTVRPLVITPASDRRKNDPEPEAEIAHAIERTGSPPRAIIAAWESLVDSAPLLLSVAPIASLVLDEIHLAKSHRRWIKTPTAVETGNERPQYTRLVNRSATAQRLANNARHRLGLTATPIPDRVRDVWAQQDLIHPRMWGKFWDFCARYTDLVTTPQGYLDNRGVSNVDELQRRLSFVCHRVDYSVTHRDLPPKRRQILYIPKSAQDKPGAFARELERARKLGRPAMREVALAAAASRKRSAVLDQVIDATKSGAKIVIFTGRHNDCERLHAAVSKSCAGVPTWMAHGGHTVAERDRIREAYMAQRGPCVLIGTGGAWGESLNLHDSDLAIFAMLPINARELWQWEGRFARHGMTRPVLIIYTVAEGTYDEAVNQILLSKLPAVADLQQDSEFAAAASDLAGGGMDEELLASTLLEKIIGGVET